MLIILFAYGDIYTIYRFHFFMFCSEILTQWHIVFLEELLSFQLVKKFSKCNIIIPPMHMGTDMIIVSGFPVAKYSS
jgi:hypothetical protein